jgi:hypothetical protein
MAYPPIPHKENLTRLKSIYNVNKLSRNKTLDEKVLTKKQLLLKKAKENGVTFDKKPTVHQLEQLYALKDEKKRVPRPSGSKHSIETTSPKTRLSRSPRMSTEKAHKRYSPIVSKKIDKNNDKKLISSIKDFRISKKNAFFSPKREAPKIMRTYSATKMNHAKSIVELYTGPCGYGPRLTKILEDKNITRKNWNRFSPSKKLSILKNESVVNEKQIIESFFKQSSESGDGTNKRPDTGIHNKIREHFVCTSLYQISKGIVPKYNSQKVLGLFYNLKSQFEKNKVSMIDAKPAGGQGNSHDFEILLKGSSKYSTVEFKATQTKCANENEPWSCTPQFFALQLKNAHLLTIKNEGDVYLKGWYNILKELDSTGQLFTPPGALPPYSDYIKDVYKMKRPDTSFVKDHVVFWKKFYEGMRSRGGEKTKISIIDKRLQEYTNNFLRENECKLDLSMINTILKERLAKKDFWLTWTASTSTFKLFRGVSSAFVGGNGCPNPNIKIVHASGSKKVGFDKYKLKVSGINSKNTKRVKPTFITINIYWGNRTMNPYWHFSYARSQK